MTTHSNYSLQNFSTNNAKVLTENSQPVLDFIYYQKNDLNFEYTLLKIIVGYSDSIVKNFVFFSRGTN